MVLHHHRQALLCRLDGRAFGNGPAFECPFGFESEVVMKAGCLVFLDYEAERPLTGSYRAAWFGGLLELAFGLVLPETH
jgi:hypothetical protein